MLLLWKLRDIAIIFFAVMFAFILAVSSLSITPLLPVSLYAILTVTFPTNGFTILTYISVMIKYLISRQQIYFWRNVK